jgi:Outer membrane receptor for ferrienterochelin and colicins
MQIRHNSLSKFLFLFLFILFSFSAFGQGTTGSIQGTVVDHIGAPIAGATVTLENTTNAAGFKKIVTTNERGEFTIAEIPPGKFTIKVSFSAFRTFSSDIEISTDKVALAPITLEIGGVSTEVVVITELLNDSIGATPEIRTNNKREVLEKLPSRTTFGSLLKIAPFVRPEPLAGGFQTDGASGADSTFFIDGQEVTNFRSGLLDPNYDLPFELIQEVQVKSEAINAEYGGALGGVVTVVTPGGNNDWRGNFGFSFAPAGFQGKPNRLLNRFGTALGQIEFFEPRKDGGADFFPTVSLGGRIIKDRLWFFASYSPQIYKRTRTIDYFSNPNPEVRTVSETIRYESTVRTENAFLRLDAQPVLNVRMFGTFLYNPIIQDGALPNFTEYFGVAPQSFANLRGAEFLATRGGRQNSNLATGQISWDVTRNFLLNARGGRTFLNEKLGTYGLPRTTRFLCSTSGNPQNVPGSNCQPGFQNVADNFVRDYEVSVRKTFDIDAAIYNFDAAGRHHFKFGYQYNHLFNDIREGYADTGFVQLYYGIPISALIGLPETPGNLGSGFLQRYGTVGKSSNANQAFYVQDLWRIKDRLSVNLGIRFENEDLPDYGSNVNAKFGWSEKIAPRLAAAFDLTGNGKTKIFGSYGWYYDRFKFNASQQIFPLIYYRDYFEILPDRGAAYTNYIPSRILGDNVDVPGGVCPIVNSTGWSVCQLSFSVPSNLPILPDTLPIFAEDLKPTRNKELTVGIEHKFGTSFLFSSRYIQRRLDNVIEDIGTFNSLGNEVYTIGNPGRDAVCERAASANLPCAKAERKYDAFELILDKRSPNYFFNVSYTYSRLFGNYSGLADSDDAGLVSPNRARNFDLPSSGFDANGNPDNGRLATDRPHVFKAYGGYTFRWFGKNANQTSVSAFTTIQSGTPLTTFYSLYGIQNSILNGRGDLGRTETFSETDLRIGHRYKFGWDERFTLEPFVVILNLFDERNELNRQTSISLTNFTFSTLSQSGCTTCTSQSAVYTRLFNGGIRQFVQNYLNQRGVSSTGIRNDYNQPNLFQQPRHVRLGVSLSF